MAYFGTCVNTYASAFYNKSLPGADVFWALTCTNRLLLATHRHVSAGGGLVPHHARLLVHCSHSASQAHY